MGLDISAYRVKKSVADKYEISSESDYTRIFDALEEEAKINFKRTTNRMLAYMRTKYNNAQVDYRAEYLKFIQRLRKNLPLYGEYEFYLKPLGYNGYQDILEEEKTPVVIEEVFNEHYKILHYVHDAYFRKVNFIYEYFRNDMENERCIVDKSRIGNLIDICKDVLRHKGDGNYAKKNLPTTSGFFFGSTDYDEWYWNDVKNCLKQMRKLYKTMSDDDFVVWEFSW